MSNTTENTKTIARAFKFAIAPNKRQAEIMLATGQDAAYAYNWVLNEYEQRTGYSRFRSEYMAQAAIDEGVHLHDPKREAERKGIEYTPSKEEQERPILTKKQRQDFFKRHRDEANQYAREHSEKFRAARIEEIAQEKGFILDPKVQDKKGKLKYPKPKDASVSHKNAGKLLFDDIEYMELHFTDVQNDIFSLRHARDFTTPRYSVLSGAKNADKAFWNMYLGRARHPKFKNTRSTDVSFGVQTDGAKFLDGEDFYRVSIPPVREMKSTSTRQGIRVTQRSVYKELRTLLADTNSKAKVTSITISHSADTWYMSVAVTYEAPAQKTLTKRQQENGDVGVDLGITTLAALSDGTHMKRAINKDHKFKGKRMYSKRERRIRMLQRSLSRMPGGRKGDTRADQSHNYKKTQAKIAQLKRKQAEARRTESHTLTKHIATHYQDVMVEDLNVKGMSAAPKPKPDPNNPGKYLPNGRASKTGLARGIHEAGFYEFKRQLEYKTDRYSGTTITPINRFFPSSQTCSACGTRRTGKDKIDLSVRTFTCINPECDYTGDRDTNAAIVILQEGTRERARKRVEEAKTKPKRKRIDNSIERMV